MDVGRFVVQRLPFSGGSAVEGRQGNVLPNIEIEAGIIIISSIRR